MDIRYLILGIGIVSMTFAYALFTGAQYFSAGYMLLLLTLPLASAALLLLSNMIDRKESAQERKGNFRMGLAVLLSGLSVLIIIIEANFVAFSNPISVPNTIRTCVFILALAFSAVVLAYVLSLASTKKKGAVFSLVLIVCIIASSVAYAKTQLVTTLGPSVPVGTDELAVDYYSAGAFLAGHNPYTTNFKQELYSSGITPARYLNGTCQCSITYPALAFLLLTPFAALISNYSDFLLYALALSVAALISVLLLLFRTSRNNKMMLLPAFAISIALFSVTPWAFAKNTVMLVLLLAYLLRKRAYAYPALLGIAVSTHEIAWIALPFFLLLTLKEDGVRRALGAFAFAAAMFLVINSYFIYASGSAFLNALLSAPGSGLWPRGLNIMQYLIVFYPVDYGYMLPFFISLYVVMLLLFYLYKNARPLMCVATAIMFMFSAESSLTYILPFMPILACFLIEGESGNKDVRKRTDARKIFYSACALAAAFALFMLMTFSSHAAYVQANTISIVQALPIIANTTQGVKALPSVFVVVGSSLKNETDMYFYLLSIRPVANRESFVHLPPANATSPYANYTVFMGLYNITNSTKVKVFASVNHYITST